MELAKAVFKQSLRKMWKDEISGKSYFTHKFNDLWKEALKLKNPIYIDMLLATFEARAIFGLKEFSHRNYWYLLKEIQKTKNRERAKKRRKLLEDLEDKVVKILFTLSIEFLYVNSMNYEKDYYAKNVALKGFMNDLRYSRLLTEERKMYFRQIPLEELFASSYIAADFAKSQLRGYVKGAISPISSHIEDVVIDFYKRFNHYCELVGLPQYNELQEQGKLDNIEERVCQALMKRGAVVFSKESKHPKTEVDLKRQLKAFFLLVDFYCNEDTIKNNNSKMIIYSHY